MIRNQIHRGLLLMVFVLLAVSPALLRAQDQMNSINLARGEQTLRDAYDAVKKHYYDPHFHGIDLDARYKEYDEKIKNAPSLSQAFGIVAGFLDGLKDTHTFFEPPPRPYRVDYGFRIQIIGENCFITQVRPGTDAASKLHPGDQVIGYNNFAVNRGDLWNVNYYFNGLSPQKASVLDLHDIQGQPQKITVDAKVRNLKKVLDFTGAGGDFDIWETIREAQSFDRTLRQRYVEKGDVMIWKMPMFDLSDDDVDHLFSIARKHNTLILDLRGNPGGAVVTLQRMIGNVFDHDIKIGDLVGRKESKPEIAKSRGGSAFTGKLIVLVDADSASSSEIFARVMQLEHRGTVLGDRSMGAVMEAKLFAYWQGTDTRIYYGFSVTQADLIMKDGKSLEHIGVTPDEILLPTAQDLAEGRDPVLAHAAELANWNLDPVAAAKLFPIEWLPD